MKKMNDCLRETVQSIMKSTRTKSISDVKTTMKSIKGTPIANIERGMEIEERTLISNIETGMENGEKMLIANIEARMANEGLLMADIGWLLDSFEQQIRELELQFNKEVSQRIFTANEINGEDDTLIEVILIDPCTGDVELGGPEASGIVEIVVLKGVEFDACEGDKWFKDNVVQVELGKRPLLDGNVNLKLERGKAVVKDIKFRNATVNIKPPMFRLGARFICPLFEGTRVKEAKTRVFTVKIYREEYKRKHDVPSLSDEVWRLRNIGKGGNIQRRMRDENITNVNDFLTQLEKNPENLKRLFGLGTKKWEETVNNARACSLDQRPVPGVESAHNHPLDSFALDCTDLLDIPGPSEMTGENCCKRLKSAQWDEAQPRAENVRSDDTETEHGHPQEATNSVAFVDRACLKPDEVGPSGVGCECVYERLEECLHVDPFSSNGFSYELSPKHPPQDSALLSPDINSYVQLLGDNPEFSQR